MATLDFSKIRDDSKVIYEISGRLDTQSTPDFQEEIENCFSESEKEYENKINLVFDFKNVEYMSSAGLRAILYAKKHIDTMSEGSSMEIINVSPEVMEIFEMTGFSDFISLKKINN